MKRVLIVDDDALIRESLCRGLAFLGYETADAADGQEALQQVERFAPDAVICDLFMPEMDGLEFLARMASRPDKPLLIVVSGGSTHLDLTPDRFLNMARRLGANAVLRKPFSLTEIMVLLESGPDGREHTASQQQKGVD